MMSLMATCSKSLTARARANNQIVNLVLGSLLELQLTFPSFSTNVYYRVLLGTNVYYSVGLVWFIQACSELGPFAVLAGFISLPFLI